MVKVTMAIWQFLRIGVTANSILGVKFGFDRIFRFFFPHKRILFWEHCSRHIVINVDGNSFAQPVTVISMLIKASACDNYSLGMIMMNSAYVDCRVQDMDAFSFLSSDKVPEYLRQGARIPFLLMGTYDNISNICHLTGLDLLPYRLK